jgi:pimeloyl-ACP methyl ester carboxylesterase
MRVFSSVVKPGAHAFARHPLLRGSVRPALALATYRKRATHMDSVQRDTARRQPAVLPFARCFAPRHSGAAQQQGSLSYARLPQNRAFEATLMKKFPLVLVPGLLCDAQLWQPQVGDLADVADTWIADHTRSDTMAGVARDVLVDVPFSSFALAGLSMGGYIALEIMRQAPQRVARLALLDTVASAELPEQTQRRRDFIALAEGGHFARVTETLLPLLTHPARQGERPLADTIKSMARNIGMDAFIRQEHAIMSRADSRGLLATIACPTLVLCGRQDALTPLARHEEMAAGIRGARLEVIEDCGHLSTLERPAEVNAALRRWLTA